MKLKTPIEIDFLGFFKTGKFDCLKLGQSKEWILNNFPNPDSRFDLESEKSGFDIWTYDDIELHFENDILFLIYSDHWYEWKLEGGENLNLDKWIFDDISRLTLNYVLESIRTAWNADQTTMPWG
jgi:hypothetical protein